MIRDIWTEKECERERPASCRHVRDPIYSIFKERDNGVNGVWDITNDGR